MRLESRRKFLVACLSGVSAALAAAAFWPMWRYLAPEEGTGQEAKARLPRRLVPVGRAHYFTFRGHPAVVLQPVAGRFIALSAVCTHLGCIVKWQPDKDQFLCPCHAGYYSPTGQVLGGPPPKPLESYPVNMRDQELVIG